MAPRNEWNKIPRKPFFIWGFLFGGRTMIFIALGIFCGIAIGALCAPLHCRVYVILAVSAFLAAGATVGGVIFHTHFWMIAAEGIGLIAAAQFGYVAVGLTLQYWLDAAFRGVGSAKSRNSMRRDHQRQRSSSMLRSSRWHKEEVARASFRFCEGRAFFIWRAGARLAFS